MSEAVNETTNQDADEATATSGLIAQFAGPEQLLAASNKVREAGCTNADAYSPFPIHGIDEALGIKRTILPWFVLAAGLSGGFAAGMMQWWMNATDTIELPLIGQGYSFLISGKPQWSLPANIPVIFEVIILSSAFAALFGMFALNGLPKFYNPLMKLEPFRRVTDDGFFLHIQENDPGFNQSKLESLFQESGAVWVDGVPVEEAPGPLPGFLKPVGMVMVCLAMIPPALIAYVRSTPSEATRIDIWTDMDYSEAAKAQEASTLFADGRSNRSQITGTIAFGDLQDDDAYFKGYLPDTAEAVAGSSVSRSVQLTSVVAQEGDTKQDNAQEGDNKQDGDKKADVEAAGSTPAASKPSAGRAPAKPKEPNYIKEFPEQVTIDQEFLNRGQLRFNIYCATCHGQAGKGNGLVSLRAKEINSADWLPPTDLTSVPVMIQPIGKIYDTISNGRRKMAGYKAQIPVKDRWAIAAYVRALQESQNASIKDVPDEQRAILESQK
ncbi:MAG: quinol:electron acceptor oxidoreductase subunit ActD [Fuerstiella sp.]